MIQQKQDLYQDLIISFQNIRREVLKTYLGEIIYDEFYSTSIAQKLPEIKQKNLLKDLYNNCRLLGQEISKKSDRVWSTEEILELLFHTNIPSIIGDWKVNKVNNAHILTHDHFPYEPNKFIFRYWEKVISGLVSGLNESIHYVINCNSYRQKQTCIQTIYDSNFFGKQLKEVPLEIKKVLLVLTKKLAKFDINLILDGYLDGLIFYHFEGYSISSLELFKEKIITDTFINLAKMRVRDIKFIEVIK